MVLRCQKYPGISKVFQFLETYLRGKDDDRSDFEVSFKQWAIRDRSDFINQTLPVDKVLSLVNAFIKHSYIACNQS